jgi:hypothetical protein
MNGVYLSILQQNKLQQINNTETLYPSSQAYLKLAQWFMSCQSKYFYF